VRVGDERLEARRAVILATGSAAGLPPIDGLTPQLAWTNREATTAKGVPAALVVLGGGVVGVELAEAWSALGSEVVLLEAGDRLLPREEPFASEQVTQALRDRGVDVRLGANATHVARDGDGVRLGLEGADDVRGDELLVATGRTPRTQGLGLEALGLQGGEPVPTDGHLCVPGHDWLYAVGDCNGRSLLTHQGKYQARVAADHILGRGTASLVYGGALSPRVVFTEPQVAAVGYTLQAAREAGLEVRCVEAEPGKTAGGSFVGKNVPGTACLVVDENRRVVVGATFTGPEVAELLHAATIAIVADVPMDRLWHAVPAFPTRNEVWLALMEAYGL
jgi:pyruvate/2-oxoglutarate dehydrogenase complex dihydrolipoamide dehydrogenase (E3) component